MHEIKWIKITTSMFDDEKIKLIRKLPESDSILLTWIQLLIQAGKANASGSIVLNETIPYTEEMLATIFDRPIQIVRLALNTFQQFGMIDVDGGVISITNWEKHQNIDALEKIREQERLRKQRQREKYKLLEGGEMSRDSHGTATGHVTQCHATDIDIEEDKELDKEKDIEITPLEREILHIFSSIKLYKLDYLKDIQFIRQIFIDFPDVNVLEVAKKFAVNKIDKPLTAKSNPRSQFRNWCNNESKWQKERGVKSGGNRPSNLTFSLDERILAKQRERPASQTDESKYDDLF